MRSFLPVSAVLIVTISQAQAERALMSKFAASVTPRMSGTTARNVSAPKQRQIAIVAAGRLSGSSHGIKSTSPRPIPNTARRERVLICAKTKPGPIETAPWGGRRRSETQQGKVELSVICNVLAFPTKNSERALFVVLK
jgi:hypothetical protein